MNQKFGDTMKKIEGDGRGIMNNLNKQVTTPVRRLIGHIVFCSTPLAQSDLRGTAGPAFSVVLFCI